MKYIRVLLPMLLFAVILFLPGQAFAEQPKPIQLYLEEKKLEPEVPPRIVGAGTTIVPVRIVGEELGAIVYWNEEKREVRVVRGSTSIELKIDDRAAKVNGIVEQLEEPPTIHNGNTLVPIRFVAENLGLLVKWDQVNQAVLLSRKSAEPSPNGGGTPNSSEKAGTGNAAPDKDGQSAVKPENGAAAEGGQAKDDEKDSASANGPADSKSGQPAGNGSEKDDKSAANPSGNPKENQNPATSGSEAEGEKGGAGKDQAKGKDPSGKDQAEGKDPSESKDPTEGKGATEGKDPPKSVDDESRDTEKDAVFNTVVWSYPAPKDLKEGLSAFTSFVLDADRVKIRTSGDVTAATSVLKDPYRIIIDLPNTVLGGFENKDQPGKAGEFQIEHPMIEKVRYSQFSVEPMTVRIVLDMKQPAEYRAVQDKYLRQWTIELLEPEAPQQKEQYVVVIDPGHGGTDPGAESVRSRMEKDFNLSLANKVYALLLEEPAIKPVMTRMDDSYPTLDDRVELANSLEADLFISIHGNKFEKPISGTETYYARPESEDFAHIIHKHVLEATGFADRNVRQEKYKVVRDTNMPAVLVEVGYLSNPNDEALMFSEPFQKRVAKAIVAGIKEQLRLP
jgi:N-acetylmuramoyl-L-alanine amidase